MPTVDRLESWPVSLHALQDDGFTVAALARADDSVSLDDVLTEPPDR